MTTILPCHKSAEATPDKLLLAATSAALLTLIPVAAHQLGYLSHLPDPPAAIFDSDRITESTTAHPLGIPDSLLGLGSYGLTLTLILLARSKPKARRLLALKLIGDGSIAGFNMVRQITKFGKLCSWCTVTALCTAAMVAGGRKLIAKRSGNTADAF
ncbi:MAG: vitamin K epoxide reductase family protein [Silvibacterium sp.]